MTSPSCALWNVCDLSHQLSPCMINKISLFYLHTKIIERLKMTINAAFAKDCLTQYLLNCKGVRAFYKIGEKNVL